MKLVTLADVRELIEQHLPTHFRDKATWRVVAKDLKAASLGADPAEVSIALRIRWKAWNAGRSDAPPLPAHDPQRYYAHRASART